MCRHNCVRNLVTPLVCARRHRQMTIKCTYSRVELMCNILRAHGQALHEDFTWATKCEAA